MLFDGVADDDHSDDTVVVYVDIDASVLCCSHVEIDADDVNHLVAAVCDGDVVVLLNTILKLMLLQPSVMMLMALMLMLFCCFCCLSR